MLLLLSVDFFIINFFKNFFQEHYKREQSDQGLNCCFKDKIKSEVQLNICSSNIFRTDKGLRLDPFLPFLFLHPQLDDSISNFRVVGWYFSFLFKF